jgi:hypothetical protein
MSRTRENSAVTALKHIRCDLPILAVCLAFPVAAAAQGQKVPPSASSATPGSRCEGTLPQQASSQSGSSDSQAVEDAGADRLKLSTKPASQAPDPVGQFCRREHSDQKALRTSGTSDPPETPPPPPQPAAPPVAQVTDGKLAIRASGQDFASVLESVRSATGLTVEMPPGINSDPVFLNVGPAPVADALVALLEGTNYNYIIVGSEGDSRVVKRLILTERSTGPATLVASSQGPPAAPQPGLYGGVETDAEAEASEPPPVPPAPIQPSVIPSSVPTGINVQKLAGESGKTVGQVLDELQKQQLQVIHDQAVSQSQSAPQ